MEKKTIDFALEIIYYSEIWGSLKKFERTSQLFRSGTPSGANTTEAKNAGSSADFIHKFKIVAKEADETNYWIDLCKAFKHYPDPPAILCSELEAITLIISKIMGPSLRKNISN